MLTFTRVGLFSLYIILVMLILIEVLVRVWGYSTMYLYDPIYMPYSKSPLIPYVMKPNLHHVRAHGNIWINTDSLGLRSQITGRTYGSKETNEYRIAFVGDSVTFGAGVPTEKTYPVIVQNLLNQRQNHCQVTVFNFGVSSYSVKEMAATLKYRVPKVNPDLVIMSIVYNDFDTNRTPEVDKWGYNTHGKASKLVNEFPTLKYLLRNIHTSYLLRDIITRLIKTQNIVELTDDNIPTFVANSYNYLKEFKETAEEYGYSYLVLILPSAEGNGKEFNGIIKKMGHDKINYFNTSYITPQFTYDEFHASKYDWHPSALVNNQIAEMLIQYLLHNVLSHNCHNR
jgi:hypothetical protein